MQSRFERPIMKNQHETPEALAHELFTAAQLAPGEGIEDAVGRLAALVEAHQHARIAELEAQLSSSGFTAADMATAAAQGFRDGVASLAANAGEPVAHLWQHCETGRTRIVMPDMIVDADASWQVVGPLYLGAAPPTAQAEGWRLVPVEPTPEMVDAAQEAYMPFGDMQLAIQLAIAAAPQPVAREPLSAEQYNA